MNVHVKTTNFDMTPEVSAYLDEKVNAIEKLITPHDPDTVQCDVELARSVEQGSPQWRAEMNISIGKHVYRAEAKGANVQAALDEVKDEMLKRLRRDKRKRMDFIKRGGARLKELLRFGRRG